MVGSAAGSASSSTKNPAFGSGSETGGGAGRRAAAGCGRAAATAAGRVATGAFCAPADGARAAPAAPGSAETDPHLGHLTFWPGWALTLSFAPHEHLNSTGSMVAPGDGCPADQWQYLNPIAHIHASPSTNWENRVAVNTGCAAAVVPMKPHTTIEGGPT